MTNVSAFAFKFKLSLNTNTNIQIKQIREKVKCGYLADFSPPLHLKVQNGKARAPADLNLAMAIHTYIQYILLVLRQCYALIILALDDPTPT